ncbi:MAG: 3-phosphoglycerate dehydrogenase [Candidatus Roseilinea sp.]|nr:MAG: 3-phosphoglycerate dehydrogenase [Candidatus Roseilinea sp.]
MFKIWLDDTLLPSCAHLLEGIAEPIGPSPTLAGIEEAEAFICPGNVRYDGARMDRAPKLKVIARLGVGYDNIDLAAATARRIPVVYAPDAPTLSTAEHAWALIMTVAKKVAQADRAVRITGWESFWGREESKGLELHGRTLGLIGLGRIGSRVARYGLAFDMRVLAFDPYIPPARAQEMGIALAPALEDVLREADIVSLHTPATPETHHFMNGKRFAQMKRGALFINVARGALVDEQALAEALRSGQIGGAGLDVFDGEPISPSHPLLAFDNVVVTPHVASRTVAGHHRIWETTLTQALQVLRGERPPHLLNPEIWETRRR